MNRRFLTGLFILICLSFIVSKSYACPSLPPVAIISGPDRRYVSAGTSEEFDASNSFDPDGGCIVAWQWIVSGYDGYIVSGGNEPEMTCIFRTGGSYANVYLRVKDDEGTWSEYDRCYVYMFDLDADANRDGNITYADEEDEDTWSKGSSAKGAIVLPNCDDDGNNGAPDNWPGEHNRYTPDGFEDGDWDLSGGVDLFEEDNNQVDVDPDKYDLAELWVHQMSFRTGIDRTFTLEVANVSTDSFFDNVPDENIIRIFLPTDTTTEPGNVVVTAGNEAIIGPGKGNTVEFGPNAGPLDHAIFDGDGIVKFGVEGIEFGAMVDITLTVRQYGPIIGSDTVRMRVAPFVLLNHSKTVSRSGTTVYVANTVYGADNSDLITKLNQEYPGHVDASCPGDNDPWQQDGYEVGYVKAPYGNPMPVFLVLPRAYHRGAILADYVHNHRLDPGVGVCWRLEYITVNTSYNYGGNIECTLGGELFYGTDLHNDIDSFFDAQGVNLNPFSIVTDWLKVGHVDEVVSFAPEQDHHTLVADPDVCWGLLLWADSDQYSQKSATLAGHNIYDILIDNHMYFLNVDPSPPLWWKEDWEGIMEPQNLPTTLASWDPPEGEPWDTGSGGTLTKGGCFVEELPAGINTRTYWIKFDQEDNIHYSVRFKDNDGQYGDPDTDVYGMYKDAQGWQRGPGTSYARTNSDCIFKTAKCFILAAWWDRQTRDLIAPGDDFFFTVNANCTTIEMPVLFEQAFRDPLKQKERFAIAYTIDHVNCLVDGTTVFTGDPHESPLGKVTNYVQKLFNKAAYVDLVFAESDEYHKNHGDIHCGTNVIRVLPGDNWWE